MGKWKNNSNVWISNPPHLGSSFETSETSYANCPAWPQRVWDLNVSVLGLSVVMELGGGETTNIFKTFTQKTLGRFDPNDAAYVSNGLK